MPYLSRRTNGFIGFCTHREPADPNGVIITLATTDVETVYAACKKASCLKSTRVQPRFNITNAFIRDPNGYLVEIQRFEDPN